MAARNIVCLSNFDPETHEWYLEEAKKRTIETGQRVTMNDLVNIACKSYKTHCQDAAALETAKQANEPWLKEEVASAHSR